MKDKLISENTKKYSNLKKEQIIQRITKFKEMRIQIFLMQNQYLLYEVFPLKFKEKKEESDQDEILKKRLNTAENMINGKEKKHKRVNRELNILERYKTQNTFLNSQRSKDYDIEKTYRRTTTKFSMDYFNSINNHTPNLKTFESEKNLLTEKSQSKHFIKDEMNQLSSKSKNFIQITDQVNQHKSKSNSKSKSKNKNKKRKKQSSSKIINKETAQKFPKLILNTEILNHGTDVLTSEKSTNIDNKILDCLTMDNFDRTYNSNFYFSKYSNIKFHPSKIDKNPYYSEDLIKLEHNLLNNSKKFEYLITQDSIQEFDNSFPFLYKTTIPTTRNFLKKNLEKKFLIKTKESYSNVCIRNKSKKSQFMK